MLPDLPVIVKQIIQGVRQRSAIELRCIAGASSIGNRVGIDIDSIAELGNVRTKIQPVPQTLEGRNNCPGIELPIEAAKSSQRYSLVYIIFPLIDYGLNCIVTTWK